jgi:hypothetical protein
MADVESYISATNPGGSWIRQGANLQYGAIAQMWYVDASTQDPATLAQVILFQYLGNNQALTAAHNFVTNGGRAYAYGPVCILIPGQPNSATEATVQHMPGVKSVS